MKYTYAYKTSDGTRHEDSMEAGSREAVFAALRKKGIKAIKVVAADGSKANGEVRGVRKRVVAAGALFLLLVAGLAALVAFRAGESNGQAAGQSDSSLTAPRHQIYGDPAIVQEIERGKTDAWLPNRGDQMLAWFAQPGKLCCPKDGLGHSASPASRLPRHLTLAPADIAALEEVLSVDSGRDGVPSPSAVVGGFLIFTEDDPREVRELKQMVNGLREEMREYLSNGNGTVKSYWRRLIQRTQEEAQIYERTRRELERETDPAVFEQKNQSLRNLGLRTIPNPKDAD